MQCARRRRGPERMSKGSNMSDVPTLRGPAKAADPVGVQRERRVPDRIALVSPESNVRAGRRHVEGTWNPVAEPIAVGRRPLRLMTVMAPARGEVSGAPQSSQLLLCSPPWYHPVHERGTPWHLVPLVPSESLP